MDEQRRRGIVLCLQGESVQQWYHDSERFDQIASKETNDNDYLRLTIAIVDVLLILKMTGHKLQVFAKLNIYFIQYTKW
jgi:hypothetical protein